MHANRKAKKMTKSRPISAIGQFHYRARMAILSPPSCPGLTRASTSSSLEPRKDVDGRVKPGHDEFYYPGNSQSVIAIARSASRSRTDSFSVSDFNWPQA